MLRNCSACGRLLTSPAGTPCPHCLADEDALVAQILDFLQQGGTPTLASVVAGTGVQTKAIRRLVASGRITLSGEGHTARCVFCGTPLPGGAAKVCAACAAKAHLAPRAAPQVVPPRGREGGAAGSRSGFHSDPHAPRRRP